MGIWARIPNNSNNKQQDVNLFSPCQRLNRPVLRRTHAPSEVFFGIQLGQIGISFQHLADHYLVVCLVVQFWQVVKDS